MSPAQASSLMRLWSGASGAWIKSLKATSRASATRSRVDRLTFFSPASMATSMRRLTPDFSESAVWLKSAACRRRRTFWLTCCRTEARCGFSLCTILLTGWGCAVYCPACGALCGPRPYCARPSRHDHLLVVFPFQQSRMCIGGDHHDLGRHLFAGAARHGRERPDVFCRPTVCGGGGHRRGVFIAQLTGPGLVCI